MLVGEPGRVSSTRASVHGGSIAGAVGSKCFCLSVKVYCYRGRQIIGASWARHPLTVKLIVHVGVVKAQQPESTHIGGKRPLAHPKWILDAFQVLKLLPIAVTVFIYIR